MPVSGGQFISRQDMYNLLRGAGLEHPEAAPFAAVLSKEGAYGSQLYSGSFGGQPSERGGVLNPGGAYGFAQLNGPRQADLANYARSAGADPSDPATQARFLVQDARNRNIDLTSTADIVHRYEVPAMQYRAGEIAGANAILPTFNPNGGTSSLASFASGQAQPPRPMTLPQEAGGPAPPSAPAVPPSVLAGAFVPDPTATALQSISFQPDGTQQAAKQQRKAASITAGNSALASLFA